MIVTVVSHDDAGLLPDVRSDERRIIIPAATSIAEMVQQIQRSAETEQNIWLLRFSCHGNAGTLFIGEGISQRNVDQLAPLRPWFSPMARGIEFHACAVASARSVCTPEEEMNLLQQLANWLNGGDCYVRDGVFRTNGAGGRFLQEVARNTEQRVQAAVHVIQVRDDVAYDWRMGPGETVTYTPNEAVMSVDHSAYVCETGRDDVSEGSWTTDRP